MTNLNTDKQQYTVGTQVSIFLSGATSPTSLSVRMLHVTVAKETAKAVQLKADGPKEHTIWLPKKALTQKKNSNHMQQITGETYDSPEIAKWFNCSSYQNWFIDHYSSVGHVVSAGKDYTDYSKEIEIEPDFDRMELLANGIPEHLL